MKIRLLIVDDHEAMRHSLASFLAGNSEIDVIAETGDAEEAMRICESKGADVALVDVRMKGTSGVDLTRRLRAAGHSLGIVGLSMYQDEEIRDLMINAGADGYVDKMAPPPELIGLVRSSAKAAAKRLDQDTNGGNP